MILYAEVTRLDTVLHTFAWLLSRWRATSAPADFGDAQEVFLDAFTRSKGQAFDEDAAAAKPLPDHPQLTALKAWQQDLRLARQQFAHAAMGAFREGSLEHLAERVQDLERRVADERRLQGLQTEAGLLEPQALAQALPFGAAAVDYMRVERPSELARAFELEEPASYYIAFLLLRVEDGSGGSNLLRLWVDLPMVEAELLEQRLDKYVRGLQFERDRTSSIKANRKEGEQLRRDLLDPVLFKCQEMMQAPGLTHLFIIPDGMLARLPFVALPSPQNSDQQHVQSRRST